MDYTTLSLAISDTWTISLFVINLIVGALVGWLILREKQRDTRISTLEANLERKADEKIQEKFSMLMSSISEIKSRLDRGDSEFRRQHDADHGIEIKTLQAIEALRGDLQVVKSQITGALQLGRQVQRHEVRIDALEAKGAS